MYAVQPMFIEEVVSWVGEKGEIVQLEDAEKHDWPTDSEVDSAEYSQESSSDEHEAPPKTKIYTDHTVTKQIKQDLHIPLPRVKFDLIFRLILAIHSRASKMVSESENKYSILVFLPGVPEICRLHDMLANKRKDGILSFPCYGNLTPEEQCNVFRPVPHGKRKVVLATNVAETSITIDDVVWVIDSGVMREMIYENGRSASLNDVWISQASVRQRRGRAGRTREGFCFHLFSESIYQAMSEFSKPEILRTPLHTLILQTLYRGEQNVSLFLRQIVQPPPESSINVAIQDLRKLQAIQVEGKSNFESKEMCSKYKLTPLGQHLAMLPVEPHIGKLLVYGAVLCCWDDALTISALLCVKSPYRSGPIVDREAINRIRSVFTAAQSDHISMLRMFRAWQLECGSGQQKMFCHQYLLSEAILQQVEQLRQEFTELMIERCFIPNNAISTLSQLRKLPPPKKREKE